VRVATAWTRTVVNQVSLRQDAKEESSKRTTNKTLEVEFCYDDLHVAAKLDCTGCLGSTRKLSDLSNDRADTFQLKMPTEGDLYGGQSPQQKIHMVSKQNMPRACGCQMVLARWDFGSADLHLQAVSSLPTQLRRST